MHPFPDRNSALFEARGGTGSLSRRTFRTFHFRVIFPPPQPRRVVVLPRRGINLFLLPTSRAAAPTQSRRRFHPSGLESSLEYGSRISSSNRRTWWKRTVVLDFWRRRRRTVELDSYTAGLGARGMGGFDSLGVRRWVRVSSHLPTRKVQSEELTLHSGSAHPSFFIKRLYTF